MNTSDQNTVMVIHGRDYKSRDALFNLLRALKLNPMEWDELVASTGKGSPYCGEVVNNGIRLAESAVVLLTPDEIVKLRDDLCRDGSDSKWANQARPNVYIEAGMALNLYPDKTIFLEVGNVRAASDFAGMQIIKVTDDPQWRISFVERLRSIGFDVRVSNRNLIHIGDFPIYQAEGQEESWFVMPNTDSTPVENGQVSVDGLYLSVLKFAILIHHEFHELDKQGLQLIVSSAKTLFLMRSEGNKAALISNCNDAWDRCLDERSRIEEEVINNLDTLVPEIELAIQALIEQSGREVSPIICGLSQPFLHIQNSISAYQTLVVSVSSCFDKDTMSLKKTVDLTDFSNMAIALDRTVTRLISKAESMIKNVIDALEANAKVKLGEKHERTG